VRLLAFVLLLIALQELRAAADDCARCHAGGTAQGSGHRDVREAPVWEQGADAAVGHAVGFSGRGAAAATVLACTACHDLTRSDDPARLRAGIAAEGLDRVTRLCLSCHEKAGEYRAPGGQYMRHPVGVRGRVETWARAALPLYDESVGCATCHLVHASRTPFQLRFAPDEIVAACGACHGAVLGERPPSLTLRAARATRR